MTDPTNTIAPAAPIAAPAPTLPSFMFAATGAEDIGFPSSFLLYGNTGTRKTTMIAELVVAGIFNRAVIIDIDNGIETLMVDPAIRALIFDPVHNPNGRIIVMNVDPIMDDQAFFKVDAILCEMTGSMHPIGADGSTQWTKFVPNPAATPVDVDLVALDTLNVFQKQVAVKFFQSITYNSKGKLDTLAAWGEVGIYTDSLVRLFHNTNRFTGAIAMHPMTDTENTGKVSIKPDLQGGTKNSVATIPSLVAYLAFEATAPGGPAILTATVGESDIYTAKNRYRLDSKIPDFNMVRMYQLIAEKIGKPLPNYNPSSTPAAVAA